MDTESGRSWAVMFGAIVVGVVVLALVGPWIGTGYAHYLDWQYCQTHSLDGVKNWQSGWDVYHERCLRN